MSEKENESFSIDTSRYYTYEEFKSLIKDSAIEFTTKLIDSLINNDLELIGLWDIYIDFIGKDDLFDNSIRAEIKELLCIGELNVIKTIHKKSIINFLFTSREEFIQDLTHEDLLLLRETYEILSRDYIATQDLCEIYFLLGQFDNCIKVTKKVINNYIDTFKALFYLGRSYYSIGSYKKALQSFTEAFFAVDYANVEKLSIKRMHALFYISKTELKLGEYQKALMSCNNLISHVYFEPAFKLREKIRKEGGFPPYDPYSKIFKDSNSFRVF